MDGIHTHLHNRNHAYHDILQSEVHVYRSDTLHGNSKGKKHYLVFIQTHCLGHLGANPLQLLVFHRIASNSIEVFLLDLIPFKQGIYLLFLQEILSLLT